MMDAEVMVWVRIEQAMGQVAAVGELELCRCVWPVETAAACCEAGGERSKTMSGLRRKIRSIVSVLRLEYSKPILDSPKGYFLAACQEEEVEFCRSRHRRGITSLVVERIVRRQSVAEVGVQQLFEFIQAETARRQRHFERTGETLPKPTAVEAVRAIWDKLDDEEQATVRELILANAGSPAVALAEAGARS